jgi:nucleoside-diphosphate-sugar epimerase
MPRNFLVTGGAGFIGSNYVQRLLERGEKVTIYDNLSRAGAPRNLKWLEETFGRDAFQLVIGDIRNAALLTATARQADVIAHLAGQVAVTTSVIHPREDFEINALGTFNVLEAARLGERNPIVFYSSTNKVYGGMEDVEVIENDTRWGYKDLPFGCPENQPLDFHSPYGCCYSADTKILTESGWKLFPQLSKEDKVFTYNIEKNLAEFQHPTAYFSYSHSGKMYQQKNRRLYTCVTPNHKMLVSWDRDKMRLNAPKLLEAQAIAGKPMAYLLAADFEGGKDDKFFILPAVKAGPQKHQFKEKQIPMEDWVRFLGWYLAEGHCYENKKTGNCTITLTTYYRTLEAQEVMRAVGLSPVVDKHHVVATSRQLYEYLKQFGKSREKYIPANVKSLTPKYLRILLTALLDGDGNKHSKNAWRYTTVSNQLADDVQEIAIKCSLASSVRQDKEGFYRVFIGEARTAVCNLGADRSEWIDYDGMVYCVEVPNSTVLVRQQGYAYFSGNSKGAGDQYMRDYRRIYGLRTVVLRQSCIYGPRQFGIEDQGWVAWFLIAAVTGRPMSIYGDGKQIRDLLHVYDLLDAYDLVLEKIETTSGQVYNLGGGRDNTLAIWTEFGPMLEKLLGKPIPVSRGDWRPGDQKVFVADIRKAQAELGWQPKYDVEKGIRQLFEWVSANKDLF